jgi:hypothetical protein
MQLLESSVSVHVVGQTNFAQKPTIMRLLVIERNNVQRSLDYETRHRQME